MTDQDATVAWRCEEHQLRTVSNAHSSWDSIKQRVKHGLGRAICMKDINEKEKTKVHHAARRDPKVVDRTAHEVTPVAHALLASVMSSGNGRSAAA